MPLHMNTMASDSHAATHSSSPSARLSYQDFEGAIRAFLKQSERHSPWSYVEYRPRRGQQLQGYLAMTQLQHSHQTEQRSSSSPSTSNKVSTADQIVLDDLMEHLEEIPDMTEKGEGDLNEATHPPEIEEVSHDFLSVSYHIVFSPSYQVPVLYFNAYRPDGIAIPLEEIYDCLVPEEWRSSIRNAGLNGGISQQDHPILNVPYFYMHPCETVALMETVLTGQQDDSSSGQEGGERLFLESYITTWLSFTGQAIGVVVPTDIVVETS